MSRFVREPAPATVPFVPREPRMSVVIPTTPASLTPAQFCAWLGEFLDLNSGPAHGGVLTRSEIQGIRRHLAVVITDDTEALAMPNVVALQVTPR